MTIAYYQIVRVLWRSDTIPGHSNITAQKPSQYRSKGISMATREWALYWRWWMGDDCAGTRTEPFTNVTEKKVFFSWIRIYWNLFDIALEPPFQSENAGAPIKSLIFSSPRRKQIRSTTWVTESLIPPPWDSFVRAGKLRKCSLRWWSCLRRATCPSTLWTLSALRLRSIRAKSSRSCRFSPTGCAMQILL